MLGHLRDQAAWLFLPGAFIAPTGGPRTFRVAGWETLYFVDRPEEVRAVNRATGDTFLGGPGNQFLGPLLGQQSVFLLDHERHRLARRIMGVPLSKRAVDAHTQTIDAIVRERIEAAEARGRLDVGAWSRFLSLRVVARLALGIEDTRRVQRLFDRLEATTGLTANVVSYKKRFWTPRGPLSVGAYVAHLVRRIDRILYHRIAERRAEGPSRPDTALDALILQQDEHGYDDAFIRDNLTALLAAGYDTTGSALTWMHHWLHHEQGQWPSLRAAQGRGETATLEAFRAEVLRYCPPIEILPRKVDPGRRAAAEAAVPALADMPGIEAGDGPMVCPVVHRVHHDSNAYAAPEAFDPGRFAESPRTDPDTFMPFGAGPRMCLGLNVGKLIMDRTLQGLLARGVRFDMSTTRFRPVRRNVSIWPAFRPRGRLVSVQTQ